MELHTTCPLCTSEKLIKLRAYHEKKGLVRCGNCGFVFMERIPTAAELNDHYSVYAYEHAAEISPVTVKSYQRLLDEFEKFRSTNRILDAGCGQGFFLNEARKRGWEVYGTEYSERAVEICREKGIEMRTGALSENLFDPEFFDVITSFEVIEHINNPLEEIKLIKRFLRPGGLFYCTTPNFNSVMRYYLKENYNVIEYPEHLSYYTKRTLSKLLRGNGFKRIRFLTTGLSISRIQDSGKTDKVQKASASEVSKDEMLRLQIERKWWLKLAKSLVNRVLTMTGTGLTLKGYFVKK